MYRHKYKIVYLLLCCGCNILFPYEQDGLLPTLISLSESFKCQPSHVIQFPISSSLDTDFEVSVRSLDDDVLMASIRPVVNSMGDTRRLDNVQMFATRSAATPYGLEEDSSRENNNTSSSGESVNRLGIKGCSTKSPASFAPLQILLRDSTMWPTNQRGFSLSLWLMIDSRKAGPDGQGEELGFDNKRSQLSRLLGDSSVQSSPGKPHFIILLLLFKYIGQRDTKYIQISFEPSFSY